MRIDPKQLVAHNGIAWLSATCVDGQFRDGRRAVEHAMKACKLSEWKNVANLDTLAAAYAEVGEFQKAIETQQRAIELVAPRMQADFKSRLELYRAGKPYRDEPKERPTAPAK
jgi:hypothetical protein